MSVEPEHFSHEPFQLTDHDLYPLGEDSGVDMGMRVYPFYKTDEDLNELVNKPEHSQLRGIIDGIHGAGQEAFAHIDAHRGLVITILGSAAVAAGTVGIGILIRRKTNNDEISAKNT